jgi:uncharacterized protein YaiI (UPF0178 family)
VLDIFVDGDGCAVKDETYRVATRYGLKVFVVANSWMKIPSDNKIELVVVSGGFDAADDWIAENIQPGDIAITSDIPLADRCLKRKAKVLGPKGNEFTEDNIGSAMATRELMTNLRYMGEMRGGPSAMDKKARSQFLSNLDRIIQSLKNSRAP